MSTQFHTGAAMGSETMTVRLPSELKARLGTLAQNTQRTRSFLAAEAIERYVAQELPLIERIEAGVADMKAGRVTPHQDVMQEALSIIEEAQRKRAE